VELLRRGLFFVDSPGLGSSITENTETTERFFPEADAFVLITSYDSPLSEEEDRALHRIRQADRVLFVIVNKHDTVSPSERGQVLEFVKERLAQYFFSREPLVFSVSARHALDGKQSGNNGLLIRNKSRLRRQWGDLHVESEVVQAVDESQNVFTFGSVVEVIWAEILIERAVFEHVVGGGEHGGGNRSDGLFGAALGADAQVAYSSDVGH
jgi:hypothetical protein